VPLGSSQLITSQAPARGPVAQAATIPVASKPAEDVQTLLEPFNNQSRASRVALRNIQRRFEEQGAELARVREEREQLQQQVELLQPRRRRAVRLDPNEKFARIEDIKRAQLAEEMGQQEGGPADAGEAEEPAPAAAQPATDVGNGNDVFLNFLDDMAAQHQFI
jgi:hypothetical protein